MWGGGGAVANLHLVGALLLGEGGGGKWEGGGGERGAAPSPKSGPELA